jgi:hypothetical protein
MLKSNLFKIKILAIALLSSSSISPAQLPAKDRDLSQDQVNTYVVTVQNYLNTAISNLQNLNSSAHYQASQQIQSIIAKLHTLESYCERIQDDSGFPHCCNQSISNVVPGIISTLQGLPKFAESGNVPNAITALQQCLTAVAPFNIYNWACKNAMKQ